MRVCRKVWSYGRLGVTRFQKNCNIPKTLVAFGTNFLAKRGN